MFCFTGSTNGTYVSGREVRKNVRSRVYNGDSVRLGAENVNGEAFVTFDTDLVVYEGTCDEMIQIACNGDSTCTGYTSSLETPINSGSRYLIRLGGWDATSAGTGTLLIQCASNE